MLLPEVDDLPEGWSFLGVAAVVKCWDRSGNIRFVTRYSAEINEAEKRGMFDIGTEFLTEDMAVEHMMPSHDEDDDDD